MIEAQHPFTASWRYTAGMADMRTRDGELAAGGGVGRMPWRGFSR